MLKNFSNYRIVTTAAGSKSFAKIQGDKPQTAALATSVKDKPEVQKPHKVEAFYGNNFSGTSYSQSVNFASPTSQQNNYSNFLDGFVNVYDSKVLRLKYKDMYYFDSVCGTAVDLRSELPFSDYTLTGISDKAILQRYEDAMNELKPLQFLRRLLADYFVYGSTAYWMLFDDERKYFSSPVPLDLDRCTFIPTPLLNDSPFIDYQMDDSLKSFIAAYNKGDMRVRKYVEQNPSLTKLIAATGTTVPLDPETTLYLERNDLSYSPTASVSYYSRALKYYEYEKRIFRGTLDLSEKRLKSILHLMIGNDTIIPTSDTLAEISNAFKTANLDPTDAIVATHSYVQTNEVRQPTDFWRWDEISDFISRGKMVALGINEQFLSGDMAYNSMEGALSVFLEQLLWDRTYVTDKVFYKTLFPYIAKENDFISTIDQERVDQVVESRDIRLNPLMQEKDVHRKIQYQIPTIVWHKALKPKVDKDWLETLQTLKDQDIPIPYRMWLAGAGIDVDELLQEYDLDESSSLEAAAKKYRDKLETGDDYGENFEDTDFESTEDSEEPKENVDNIPNPGEETPTFEDVYKEDPFAQDREEEYTPPEERPSTENDNPQLFQGSKLNRIGLKGRKKLGDLNSASVNAQLEPRLSTGDGKTRKMSKSELEKYNLQINKTLATQLAEKDKRETDKENTTYRETSKKVII